MPHWRTLFVIAALSSAVSAQVGTNEPLRSATGGNGQFIAFAPGPVLPAALCIFAERIKHNWCDSLDIADKWHDPIVLVLRAQVATNAPANVTLSIIQIGPVLKYEIGCRLSPPPDESTLAAAVIEALCLEVANRDRPVSAGLAWKSAQIPLWLTHGLAGALAADNGWLASVARRSATAARPPFAGDLLCATVLPTDDIEKKLFQANTWLLTDSLLRLPGGTRKLQQFLSELRKSDDAFVKVYQADFSSAVFLEKWWSLMQARLTAVGVPQNLAAGDTEHRLDALLICTGGVPFRDLYRHFDDPWLKRDLPARVVELEILLNCAHPLYRPVLTAYIEAGHHLVNGNISRYRRAIVCAEKLRLEVHRQALTITAALDIAEANYASDLNNNIWQGYFRTIEKLEDYKRNRHNPIGDYLDQFGK